MIEAEKKKKAMCGRKQKRRADYNRRGEGHVLEEKGRRIREKMLCFWL